MRQGEAMSGGADRVILGTMPWQWFISCTVKQRGASNVKLQKAAFALMRQICRRQRLYFPRLLWALRIEEGIDPLHRHFHLLIGGLHDCGKGARMATIRQWSCLCGDSGDLENPKGTCRVRAVDADGNAVSYVVDDETCAKNTYEFGQFNEGSMLRYSESVVRLGRMRERGMRYRATRRSAT